MVRYAHISRELEIPDGVDVEIDGMKVRVKGPKGTLTKDFSHLSISLKKEGRKVIAFAYYPRKREKAQVGTLIAYIRNMVRGVTEGYLYKMKTVYTHFPFNVKVKDGTVYIENFLGERRPREARIFGNVKVRVEGDDVMVEGIDVEEVGQTAANIQMATKIKDKDPRRFIDGIYVYEKGGKRLV